MERTPNGSLPIGLSAEFDLKYGLKLLWGSKATILAVAFLGLGLGFLLTYLETPIYRSQALIQIDPPGQNLAALTNPYPATAFNWFDHQSYYNTQYRIIKSKALAERVVSKLKLAERASTDATESAKGLFLSRVEVTPVPDTRLAQLAVIHEDPQKAALWANTLAEAYVEQNLEAKVEATRNVYTWLQERLASAQDSVRRSEEKLYQYTEGEDLYVPQDRDTLVGGTLEKLNEAYTGAKTRRIELETALAQIRSLKPQGKALETAPQIAADPLVQSQNLKRATIESELVQLQGKYKKEHPEIKNRLTQLEQIKGAVVTQAEKIIAGLEAEYNQLRRREGELLSTVNQQKKQSVEQGRKAVQLEMLQREALSNKNLYEVILQKIKETDIAGSLRNNNVSIVETASAPSVPIRPQPVKNLLVALALGLVAGCGLVLLRDYLSHTLKDEEEVETHLGAPCLAVIPQHSDSNESIVTETYRTLCTNIIFNRDRERGNVVLITSSIPQEGKSTTALNAARALAEAGEPTLLVDFDLRRSCQHARLRLYREPGLSDFCARDLQLDAVLQQTRHKNLTAVTSGRQPKNPPALIGSRAVERLLNDCRERFTWIVLDAPPIASVTDSLLLAKLSDMVLMVVRYNKVDRKLARRSMAALARTNARVVGVVLNGLDPKQDSYHHYYSYYSNKETPEPAAKVAAAAARH